MSRNLTRSVFLAIARREVSGELCLLVGVSGRLQRSHVDRYLWNLSQELRDDLLELYFQERNSVLAEDPGLVLSYLDVLCHDLLLSGRDARLPPIVPEAKPGRGKIYFSCLVIVTRRPRCRRPRMSGTLHHRLHRDIRTRRSPGTLPSALPRSSVPHLLWREDLVDFELLFADQDPVDVLDLTGEIMTHLSKAKHELEVWMLLTHRLDYRDRRRPGGVELPDHHAGDMSHPLSLRRRFHVDTVFM